MNASVTKSDIAWLVIRLIGCWCAYVFLSMIAAALTPSLFAGIDSARGFRAGGWLPWFMQLFFFGAVAFYFIRRGKAFHALIMWEGNEGDEETSEETAFKEWLEGDGSRKFLTPKEQRSAFARFLRAKE